MKKKNQKEQNRQGIWNECSWRRYQNRKNERELDVFEIEENIFKNKSDCFYYGTFENLSISCGRGIEDWFEIVEEFN